MATATFECALYTPSGLQLFGDDKRAVQAKHSAAALKELAPKVFVLENVREFYTEDSHPRHGVYSKFNRSIAARYALSSPTMLMDSQSAGCIYRTRMFIFREDISASYGLPPWVLQPPNLAPLCPAQLLQPLSAIELSSLQVHGAYTRRKVVTDATGSHTPVVVGSVLWEGHLMITPLQASVRVWYKGDMYKVDDDAVYTSSKVRIIKESERGEST